jgi:transposase
VRRRARESSEQARLKELERKVHEMRAEAAFWKKASAYFAQKQQ